MKVHRRGVALGFVVLAGGAAAYAVLPQADTKAPLDCIAGTYDATGARDGSGCRPWHEPESPAEIMQAHDTRYAKAGDVPPGALRAAIARKQAMQPLQAKVAGAAGSWQPYGVGNLRNPGSGNDYVNGRVDNFAYDPVAQRLFAALGSGGVWMSQAQDGDVRTLANQWVSVSDALPTQVIGAVAWTAAGGGTLIAVGGEAVMGSSGYLGLGAFWSDDLGASWHQASGVPDAALAFQAAVDPTRPEVIYAATSKGLFRSSDAGRSYVNVRLPTSATCAGVEGVGECLFENYVTDVVVQEPGGTTNVECAAAGCPVVAAVGFRTGNTLAFQDGRPMAQGNGIYRSATGEPDTFARVDVAAVQGNLPAGFAPQERIGRIELGQATGPEQDHNYLYAVVQDAVVFNTGNPLDVLLDLPLTLPGLPLPIVPYDTVFNGLYVSSDFGTTWIKMADPVEITYNVTTNSALVVLGATGYGAGIQAWYNAWIKPDPTRADSVTGVPTRLAFGLEEVWQNRLTNVPLNGLLQAGPNDFNVIGAYNILSPGALISGQTTHPDQHTGIYIPTGDGGVCLFAGNDGGVYRQCAEAGAEMDNGGWGDGANTGIYALLPYGIGVAKDGTVWFGLQDNGSGLIEPDSREMFQKMGGDGFYAEVDPDNSDIAYIETQNGGLVRTTDRGESTSSIAPSYTKVMFDNWFRMDPLDALHMVTGAQEVYETANAVEVTGSSWVEVFNLGTNPDTGAVRTTTTMEVLGDAVYVGGCGDCGVSGNDAGFGNVLATNVGGAEVPERETSKGWHFATASGLPNRYITGIAIDPQNPNTIYVTLAGYLSNLRPPGAYLDPNADIGAGNVFKSTDAGESFVNVSGNLPDVQTNTVVLHGSRLIVGTDIGAFISSDTSGGTWAPLGTGLPNVPVNMLRLQPGNTDRLFAATFGRGVWEYDLRAAGAGGGGGGGTTDRDRFGGALGLQLLFGLVVLAGLRARRRYR